MKWQWEIDNFFFYSLFYLSHTLSVWTEQVRITVNHVNQMESPLKNIVQELTHINQALMSR